ncbi:MAG TPA: TetR/AcrR family transcriptional regulator [Steroidobacteraceae bacterium]|nr:TetR/AcrR family transcriptional regulator [Steroidobacteraceae bacterium]
MSYITERRQEEKDRRRGEIVDAAEALYAETGWDAITMDQVARRARLSRALLYVYFKDKQDLHLALVERALDALRESFLEAQRGHPDGLSEVEAIGQAYLAYAREKPHYFDACARYQAHEVCSAEVHANEEACRVAGHRVHEVIVASLNRGVADGTIRNDLGNPYVTALALWAFSHGVIQIAANKGGQIEHEGTPLPVFVEHAFGLALRSLKP